MGQAEEEDPVAWGRVKMQERGGGGGRDLSCKYPASTIQE